MKVRVVEFFAGCGGTSLGFAMANKDLVDYRVVGAVEMDPHAAATFEKTLGVPVYVGDVRSLLAPAVFAEVSAPWQGPEPLVLIGCAPARAFHLIGRRTVVQTRETRCSRTSHKSP